MPPIQPNFQPGDPWTAQLLNDIIRWIKGALDIRGSPGLDVRSSGDLKFQVILASKRGCVYKGKVAAGGISARTSDAVHGTGMVEVWFRIPFNGQYKDSGQKQKVDYISSTTGGLTEGTWVNFVFRDDGGAEIVSNDCNN